MFALVSPRRIIVAFFLTLSIVSSVFFISSSVTRAQEITVTDTSADTDDLTREQLLEQIALLTQLVALLQQKVALEQQVATQQTATTTEEADDDTIIDGFSCKLYAPSSVAYGDTFTLRWDSVDAQYGQFVLARSGVDGFGLPEGRLAKSGSTNVVANSYGDITIKLSVFGTEGRADCTKVVKVAEPEDEDTDGITVYENGQPVLVIEHETKRYAISYCQAYANQRTNKTISCTWGNDEVFYYAPTITNPRGDVISCKVALIPTEVKVGESYVVSVNSLNANYTTLSGEGASYAKGNPNDSRTVVATKAGTFTYSAKAVQVDAQGNPAYTATCSGMVTVVEEESDEVTTATPSCTVEAIPYQTETGRKYTVKWDSTNAEYVTVDGRKMSADGFTSFSKSSAGTYTHTVKAVNGSKSSSCSTSVTIIKLPEEFENAASVKMTNVTSERVTVSYENIPFYSYVALYSTEDNRRYDVNDTYIGGSSWSTIYLNNVRPAGSYYLRVTREAPPASGLLYTEVARSSTFTIPGTTNTANAVTCSLAGSNDDEVVWSSTGADYGIISWKTMPQQYHAYHTEIDTEGSWTNIPEGETEYRMVFYSNKGPFAVCTHTTMK